MHLKRLLQRKLLCEFLVFLRKNQGSCLIDMPLPHFPRVKEEKMFCVSDCTKGSRFADEMTPWPLKPLKGAQWHKPHIINHILGLWSAPGRTASPLSRTVNRHPTPTERWGMKNSNSIPFSSLCVCLWVVKKIQVNRSIQTSYYISRTPKI